MDLRNGPGTRLCRLPVTCLLRPLHPHHAPFRSYPPTPRFLEGPCQQSRKEQVPKVNTCDGEMSSRLGKGGGLKCQRWGQGGNGRTPPTSHAVWQIAHQEQPIVKTDAAAKANENHNRHVFTWSHITKTFRITCQYNFCLSCKLRCLRKKKCFIYVRQFIYV